MSGIIFKPGDVISYKLPSGEVVTKTLTEKDIFTSKKPPTSLRKKAHEKHSQFEKEYPW